VTGIAQGTATCGITSRKEAGEKNCSILLVQDFISRRAKRDDSGGAKLLIKRKGGEGAGRPAIGLCRRKKNPSGKVGKRARGDQTVLRRNVREDRPKLFIVPAERARAYLQNLDTSRSRKRVRV